MNVHIQQRFARPGTVFPLIALGLLSGLGATAQSSSITYYASSPPAIDCADGVATTREASPELLRTCRAALAGHDLSRSDRAATLVNTGILEMRRGASAEALRLFAKAQSLSADLPDIRINVAAAQIRSGKPGLALETLAKVDTVRRDQRHIAYLNRGLAHFHLEDYERAYLDFLAAAELRPDYDAALEMLDRFSLETPVQADAETPVRPG